jgi:2-alkenal reductase
METNRPRTYLLLTIVLVLGILFGAASGGVAGYVVANHTKIVVAQPVSVGLNAAYAPTQPVVTLPAANDSAAPDAASIQTAAVELVKPATVTVINQGRRSSGSGSGAIIDKNGTIVTNNHVVQGATTLEVIFHDGTRVPAKLIGTSAEFDIAVIKVDAAVPGVASLGDSSALKLGEPVIAIGSALGGFRNTVTAGVVSGFNRTVADLDGLIQTDAAINSGNSGGPLINLKGEIIGINTLVVRGNSLSGDQAEGLGFSIPSNLVRSVVRQLVDTGVVARPFIGITYRPVTPELATQQALKTTTGAWINEITANSPAAKVGLKVGDVIVGIDGKAISDENPLTSALLGRAPGDTITLKVLRGEETVNLNLTLGNRPAS